MVRLSVGAGAPDTTSINLNRLLARLQQTLLKPDAETERRLRTSHYERSKVGINIQYARTLLLRLEQDAAAIKLPGRRNELQANLVQKRETLERLSETLEELNELHDGTDEDTTEDEDLLGDDTPSDDELELPPSEDIRESIEEPDPIDTPPSSETPASVSEAAPEPAPAPASASSTSNIPETFPSTLRSRHTQNPSQSTDTARTTGASTSTAAEHIIESNREEQENLTESLLSMAKALKDSSRAFAQSLESEKDILNQAAKGLDKNKSDMDAAQKKMNILRSMTEGKGWWGRMMLYAWIFGLMLIAIFIVGFLPKLRF